MTASRTAIKTALFSLINAAVLNPAINGSSSWLMSSRRLKLWNAVDVSKQPAMFLVQHRETYERYGVGLIRRYLDLGIWCYAPTGDESIVGDDLLDTMESALETALAPDDPTRNELTLGGLCSWARITRDSGQYIRDPGDIDGQALLILPVRVLMP